MQKTIERVIDKPNSVKLCLEVGRQNHGHFTVLPRLGILEGPMEVNGWRFVPRDQDDTYIPRVADNHVKALKNAGIVIVQEIVGHDLRQEAEKQERIARNKARAQKVGEALKQIVLLGSILAYGFVELCVAVIAFIFTADPALIVVLEDGTWLSVAEWEE